MQYETDINAYEMNQVNLYAVQGEADSRTLIFNIIEKSGVQIPTSNAVVVNKMLDLTGFTAKFYVITDSEVNFVEGTILDTQNGQVSFELSKDCTATSGVAECAIILTKDNEDLRVVGITLQVAAINIESNNALIVEQGTSLDICITIYNDDDTVYSLQSNDKIIFGVFKIGSSECLIKKIVTSSNKSGDGYIIALEPEDTQKLLGKYRYEIGLQTASDDYYIVVKQSKLTVTETLTSREQ